MTQTAEDTRIELRMSAAITGICYASGSAMLSTLHAQTMADLAFRTGLSSSTAIWILPVLPAVLIAIMCIVDVLLSVGTSKMAMLRMVIAAVMRSVRNWSTSEWALNLMVGVIAIVVTHLFCQYVAR